MEDIYQWYRKGALFYGPYKSYFGGSKKPFSEYVPKTQYSPERQSSMSEDERIEQQQNYKIKPVEVQPRIKNEVVQEKIQTPVELKKRPASYDIVEMGW